MPTPLQYSLNFPPNLKGTCKNIALDTFSRKLDGAFPVLINQLNNDVMEEFSNDQRNKIIRRHASLELSFFFFIIYLRHDGYALNEKAVFANNSFMSIHVAFRPIRGRGFSLARLLRELQYLRAPTPPCRWLFFFLSRASNLHSSMSLGSPNLEESESKSG